MRGSPQRQVHGSSPLLLYTQGAPPHTELALLHANPAQAACQTSLGHHAAPLRHLPGVLYHSARTSKQASPRLASPPAAPPRGPAPTTACPGRATGPGTGLRAAQRAQGGQGRRSTGAGCTQALLRLRGHSQSCCKLLQSLLPAMKHVSHAAAGRPAGPSKPKPCRLPAPALQCPPEPVFPARKRGALLSAAWCALQASTSSSREVGASQVRPLASMRSWVCRQRRKHG